MFVNGTLRWNGTAVKSNDTIVEQDIMFETESAGCAKEELLMYDSVFGISLAMPQWEAIGTAVILTLIIILTIVGNILVILSVFTYKPLRIVQNFFIVSLAVADLTVAILVLPLNVAYSIRGRWDFGIHICKMWLTSDVLCCTASILNLCAIAMDRFWAITDPINYAQKRNVGRVLKLIIGVWILSLLISSPPLLGWNDWPPSFDVDTPCTLTQKKSYIIYSSLGSFFIPLIIMTIVYIEIFVATRRRLRERAQASKINAMALKGGIKSGVGGGCATTVATKADPTTFNSGSGGDRERESISSELNNTHTEENNGSLNAKDLKRKKKKDKKKMAKDSIKDHKKEKMLKQQQRNNPQLTVSNENSVTDVCENDIEDNPLAANATMVAAGQQQSSQNNNDGNNSDLKASVIEIDGNNGKMSNEASITSIVRNSCSNINNNNNVNSINPMCHNNSKKSGGVYQFIEEKQKISLSKERRAARTLGIIMGGKIYEHYELQGMDTGLK